MNCKSVLSFISLASLAIGLASSKTLYTSNGDKVPKELYDFFDYDFSENIDEHIGGLKRTCALTYVENCGDVKGVIEEEKLENMKKNFDMKDYTQEELCKIIDDSCKLISLEENPLTGQKKLFTKSGKEVPRELYHLFKFDFGKNIDEHIGGLKRTCSFTYFENCGEVAGQVEKEKYQYMEKNFDMDNYDYTQEELCEIIDETCELLDGKHNPLTGQNKLYTKSGEAVPRELYYLFDYTLSERDEEQIDGLRRTCSFVHFENCGEIQNQIEKEKYENMEKNFDMDKYDYTQEELCEIINETCDLISFEENPLTGEKKETTTTEEPTAEPVSETEPEPVSDVENVNDEAQGSENEVNDEAQTSDDEPTTTTVVKTTITRTKTQKVKKTKCYVKKH